jgi:hypothetical protein
MSRAKSKHESDEDRCPIRPEDPETHRLRRTARLLRTDTLPAVAAMVTQAEDDRDSETEAALRRATDKKQRGIKDA